MKILIYLTGGVHWLGGVQYTRNLLKAVNSLPIDERPEIVLKVGKKNSGLDFYREFAQEPNVILDGPVSIRNGRVARGLNLLRRAIRRYARIRLPAVLMYADECSVAFPVKGPNVLGSAENVYWVPDFQYKHFPNFFSAEERQSRDEMYDKMLSEEGILVLSSETVRKDFLRFFPKFRTKPVRILRFCTVVDSAAFSIDPQEVCRKYDLPEKFVYLPNQLWQHKGFETAFEAIGILRDQGLELQLVSTGNKEDYRNSGHFQSLEKILKSHGVERQITMLGMIPRDDQIQIFRRAALVLQPSRFEGWSTSVEDSRALGKQIVISDIDVHLEQAPPHATFFKTGDADDLAAKLKAAWDESSAGPDKKMEFDARVAAKKRAKIYARDFIQIMKDVHDARWAKSLNRAEQEEEQLKLAALHQLLPETLRSDAVGPRFSKFVRRRRELFHPAGKLTIKQVKSTTGLNFSVNIGDHLGCDLYYGMFNEQSEYALFNALIRPGDVVVDAGANIGLYSLLGALRSGPTGKVVAFEPAQQALVLLKDNISANKMDSQISMLPICLGSHNGSTSFYEAEQSSFSGMIDTGRSAVDNVREVPVRRLDDVLSEMGIPEIAFIKVDVEGAEAQVLEGAMQVLETSDAIIELEISTKNGDAAETNVIMEALAQLEERFNYVAYCISSDLKKLIRFNKMREIFDGKAIDRRNNYFLVRQTHKKTEFFEQAFAACQPSLMCPNQFFGNRFKGELSRNQLKALQWAERERGLLAIDRAENALRRIQAS